MLSAERVYGDVRLCCGLKVIGVEEEGEMRAAHLWQSLVDLVMAEGS